MASLGTLTLDLACRLGAFEQGLDKASRVSGRKAKEIAAAQRKAAQDAEKAWERVGTAIKAGFAGITIGATIGKFIQETVNAQNEQAQLAAVLKSTAQAAGYGADQLNKMAAQMAGASAFSSGEISQAQTRLLSYTNIVGNEFPKAMQAAIDMAARLGMSTTQAAEQIGKALDIPSQGLTALTKQGFKFTAEQKKLIDSLEETGDAAAAQAIVLQSIESAYEGSAKAARDTLGGSLAALKNSLNELMTGDGGSVDGAKESINQLTETMRSESTKQAFGALTSAIASVVSGFVAATSETIKFSQFLGMAVAEMNLQAEKITFGEKFADAAKSVILYGPILGRVINQLRQFREGAENVKVEGPAFPASGSFLPSGVNPADKSKEFYDNYVAGRKSNAQQLVEALDTESKAFKRATLNVAQGSAEYQTALSAHNVKVAQIQKQYAGPKAAKSEAEKSADVAEKYLKSLRDQANQIKEMTVYERLMYDIRQGSVKFGMQAQFQEAERWALMADFGKDGAKLLEEQNKLKEEGKRLTEQTLTPLEQLRVEQERINQLLAGDHISQNVAKRAQKMSQDNVFGEGKSGAEWIRGDVNPLSGGLFDQQAARYEAEAKAEEERYAKQLARLEQFYTDRDDLIAEKRDQEATLTQEHADRMAQIEQAKNDIMLASMADGFGQMSASFSAFAKEFGTENKAMLGVIKAAGIAQTIIQTYQSAQASYSAMASIPYVGPALGAAAAAAAIAGGMARVSAIRSQGFFEGGYTGAGGKFEFAGAVHKGEGVLSQRDIGAMGGPSAFESFRASLHTGFSDGGYVGAAQPGYAGGQDRGGSAIVNIIEDSSKAGQVEEKTDDMERKIINVFVSNIRSGGEAAEAIQGTWGLSRMGR